MMPIHTLVYTSGSRKPIAIPLDLKPRHRGSYTAHMRWAARAFLVVEATGASAEPSVRCDPNLPFATTGANDRDRVVSGPLPRPEPTAWLRRRTKPLPR